MLTSTPKLEQKLNLSRHVMISIAFESQAVITTRTYFVEPSTTHYISMYIMDEKVAKLE